MKRVVLHIDRVVLNGYARADRQAVVDGLRAEFARHYAEPGAANGLQGQANLDRLQAGRVAVPAGAEPGVVGRHAARGITKGLT
jgi:hypothetical protein